MKKLILITSLAVAASWLLSEPGRPGAEAPADLQPWTRVVLDDGQARLLPPPPPASPLPPSPSRPKRSARAKPRTQPPAAAESRSIPPWFPTSEEEEEARARPDAFGSRVLLGRLSASEDRARRDLRQIVERQVADWVAADVPTSWKVPPRVLDAMRQGSYTQEATKALLPANAEEGEGPTAEVPGLDGLYTLYRSGQKLDFSPARRAEILGLYRKDLASARMHRLGGGLALALVGLAVLSGYIKADEATKGYYTNRLRLAAAAGLGVAGVAAYRYLA